jgi:hypothetical protein
MSGEKYDGDALLRSRRRWLKTVSAAATAALAGCGGDGSGGDGEDDGQTPADDTIAGPTPTAYGGGSTSTSGPDDPSISDLSVDPGESSADTVISLQVDRADVGTGTAEIRNPGGEVLASKVITPATIDFRAEPDGEADWPAGTYTVAVVIDGETVDEQSFEVSHPFELRNFRQRFGGRNVEVTFDIAATGNFWVKPSSLSVDLLADSPTLSPRFATTFGPAGDYASQGSPVTESVTFARTECGVSERATLTVTSKRHTATTDPFTVSFGPPEGDGDSIAGPDCASGRVEGLTPVSSRPKE